MKARKRKRTRPFICVNFILEDEQEYFEINSN
jgi:hypothetical protein